VQLNPEKLQAARKETRNSGYLFFLPTETNLTISISDEGLEKNTFTSFEPFSSNKTELANSSHPKTNP
jgi:hypothetical protein